MGQCLVVGPHRSTQRYEKAAPEYGLRLVGRMHELAAEHHGASVSTIRRPRAEPGQSSSMTPGPAFRATYAIMAATRIASSSWPAIGMKSGTRSNGSARYGISSATATFARRGTRESPSNLLNSTMQSGMNRATSRASPRRPSKSNRTMSNSHSAKAAPRPTASESQRLRRRLRGASG
jgi:hypothetical protein